MKDSESFIIYLYVSCYNLRLYLTIRTQINTLIYGDEGPMPKK